MRFINKLIALLFVLSASCVCAQTVGFNYQALILNNVPIQIPGTDIKENQVPLIKEEVVLRFSIESENGIEYTEEHKVTTDENGMISLIVGEGSSIYSNFSDIVWDGKLKYLNVEMNIPSNKKGFVALDKQKILYMPHPTQGGNVKIATTIGDIQLPYKNGDLIWVKSFGQNNKPTLLIWDGTNWIPVSEDYDATNELALIVVDNVADRDTKFATPKIGDQVWNKECGCLEVYDGSRWILSKADTRASNGLFKDSDTIKLGGKLDQPTAITTDNTNTLAIKGLETDVLNDETEIVTINKNTGILKKVAHSSLVQEEVVLLVATDGQKRFSTPLPITNPKKVNVYRNGVRIDFTAVNQTTIELELDALCYVNDEIRIIQFY